MIYFIKGMYDMMIKKFFNKVTVSYILIFLLDIVLVIFCATKNKVNYTSILGDEFVIGKNSAMFLGRNYVNVFITLFFYLYILAINKVFLHVKNTRGKMIMFFLCLVILNLVLFFVFTKRVY